MSHEPITDVQIEEKLLASIPSLPPDLRGRVLRHCRVQQNASVRQQRLIRWRVAGALTCALVMQWLVVGFLDAQRAMLFTPQGAAGTTPSSLVAGSPTVAPRSIKNSLQSRSRTLALLMSYHEPNSLVYEKETNDVSEPIVTPTRTPRATSG